MENKKMDSKIEQAESDIVAESEEKIKVELKPERIIDVDKAYEEGL